MTNESKEELTNQKSDLTDTLEIVIGAIRSVAESVKAQEGKTADKIKQLKELTGAAKELYALITVLSEENESSEKMDGDTVFVCFEGGGDQWGK